MKPTLLSILLICLLAGCAQPRLAPAPIQPSQTAQPSATLTAPVPTSTGTPAPSLTPTVYLSPTPTPLPSPVDRTGQHAYQVEVDGETVRFLLYFPESYPKHGEERKYPLILFLHGSGQGGSQLERVAAGGLPQRLPGEPEFPFIVVSPQLPNLPQGCSAQNVDDYMVQCGWVRYIERLEGLMKWMEVHTAIDPQREYLTGLSMGGFGAWEYAMRYPKRFAAVAPIAGGLEYARDKAPADICTLKDLPVWAFHGELDTTVAPSFTTVLVEALRKCGGSPKLTLYPNEGHSGSWNLAYSDQELFDWMLSHQN